jgi:CBS domain-containing protein
MTSPAETVSPTTSFKEVAARLRERAISAVPVIDAKGTVVGIVSEADLLLKEERVSLEAGHHVLERRRKRTARAKAAGSSAGEVMTSPVITVGPDAPVAEAARVMHRHAVKRLVVVDDAKRAIGIVSRGDLLKVYARTDEEIRREIVDEVIAQTLMLDPGPIGVTVEAGVVRLNGAADRRSDARLIERIAGQVDGVVDVRSQLVYRVDDTQAPRFPPRELDTWPLRY